MSRFPLHGGQRWMPLLMATVGGGVLLAGCGGSSSGSTSTAPTSSPSTAAATAAASVTATENEFHIVLSRQTFSPGTYTFKATNAGKFPHALTINGPGVSSISTSNLSPGQSASLTVTLTAGSYEIYCPVDHHKSLGMDLHITVGSAGAATTSSSGGTTDRSY